MKTYRPYHRKTGASTCSRCRAVVNNNEMSVCKEKPRSPVCSVCSDKQVELGLAKYAVSSSRSTS